MSRQALRRLARLAKKIHYNEQLRKALKESARAKGCPEKLVRRPVKTRWNYTTVMLGDAIDIRPALQSLLLTSKHKLGAFALSEAHWKVLTELHELLLACVYCYFLRVED